MLPEKRLRHVFRPIGQQSDSQEIFLLREIDRVFEKLVAITLALILRVHHQVLQKHDEPAFGRADGEEQIDHPHDRAVAAQHKNPATTRLFENESQAAQLFVLSGRKVALLSRTIRRAFSDNSSKSASVAGSITTFSFPAISLRIVIPEMRPIGNL